MMYNGQRMKAVRTPLATALVVVVVMLIGCGPFFGPEPGPSAPRFDPPAGTYNEHQWVSIKNRDGQLYVTMDPAADILEFKPMWDNEEIFVGETVTIRAYVIDDRGLRSPIAEAEYIIDTGDTTAPTISSPGIHQTYAEYFHYEIQWDAWPPDGTNDSNPSDDLTDWYNLEFAVYASPGDNIDTIEDAEINGSLVKDWHSENMAGGVGYAYCTASHAGERRYINVFVRDQEGNTSAYGSVRMESRVPPPDIYLERQGLGAEVWLNQFDASFTDIVDPSPAVITDTYAVALVDLNDDGLDDLVASYWDAGTGYQAWFASVGNGTFSDTPNYFEEGSDIAYDIEVADLNLDGTPDIIFANSLNGLTETAVYSADGSLLFTVPTFSTDFLAVGDINADGYPDIVTGDNAGGEKVQVWINTDGTGVTKAPQTSWIGIDDVSDPLDVHLADLDGDGDADLLVASATGAAQIYYSDGNSALDVEDESSMWFDEPYRVTTADWNGDGWLDLIFANDFSVLPNVDTRIFISDRAYGFGVLPVNPSLGRVPLDIEVADFNDDGWPDFVQTFTPFATNPFQVWMNDGSGGVVLGFSPFSGGDDILAVGRLR